VLALEGIDEGRRSRELALLGEGGGCWKGDESGFSWSVLSVVDCLLKDVLGFVL
jgi:hypothetical protein